MTNRNSIAVGWATDVAAFVVDPETDTTHPSGEGGPGKTARGWDTETEPEEWENYIIKMRDTRIITIAQNGRVPWDEDVYYKLGSLTYYSGILYVAILGSNHNKNPVTQTTYWAPVKFTTAAAYMSTLADMQNKFTVHTIAGVNAHGDDIVAIGGNYATAIDAQVKVVSDGLAAHVPRVDNPHVDTAIGIGTLPTTGGDFTGQVNYLQNLSVGTNCELMANISTFVAFRSNAGAIGVGVADYHLGGRWQHIFTVASFPSINQLYHPTFVLPKPDLHFPFMSNLSAINSATDTVAFTRAATLSYTDRSNNAQTAAINAPAFETSGLKLAAGTSMLITSPGLFGARDGCISYTLNGAVVVKDIQFTSPDLAAYFGSSGNVKNFRVWSVRLTPRQKLSIPR